MAQEETILLHFDIDEQPAVNSIKDLRAANSQLRAERDKVNISTKEGQELVQKLNVAIDKNNKLIKDNSSALEKQRQNVGNYSKSIEEAAGNLNIMGTNVGGLATKLSSFVNPATAAVAVVGALGAAYASSTIGARDLSFAQNQLAAATGIVTNEFASLISSAEDGEGALTGLLNNLLNALGPAGAALAAQSKGVALAKELLEDLNRDEIIARGLINERLAENQELLTKIQDSQTEYNEKIHLTTEVISNLRKNEEDLLKIKNQQLVGIERQLASDSTNEKLLDERAIKLQEISAILKDTERKVGGIQRMESNLLDIERARLEVARDQTQDKEEQQELDKLKKETIIGSKSLSGSGVSPEDLKVKLATRSEEEIRAEYQRTALIQKEIQLEQLAATSLYFNAASTLAETAFGEGSELFQALSIGQTLINTYSAATAALAPPPIGAGPLLGPALAAATIATGLANVARISGVGFAAGGGDFVTTKPTLLMVGDNPGGRERVTVEPLSGKGKTQINPRSGLLQMAGGGSLTVSDAGFVANSNQAEVRQAQMLANALKNQPPIFASWTEGRAVGRRVEFKEKVTRQ